jgi:hypothetical protein
MNTNILTDVLGPYEHLFSPQPENRSGRTPRSMGNPNNADGFITAIRVSIVMLEEDDDCPIGRPGKWHKR